MSEQRTPNPGGSRLEKKTKKTRTRKERIRLRIIIALVVVLALLIGLFALYRSWAKKPPVDPVTPSQSATGDMMATSGPEMGGDRKEDFYTFLVVGRDTGGGGNTDTILLAAYDVANQELNVMSIPRDTMVNVPWDIKRINSVYNFYGGGDEGIEALYKEVSQLVGFVPDFEVVVEWEAIGELVDAIGGVWFDVPRNMYYDDPTQDLHIHISAGYQELNGEQAMGVLRWRQNNDGTGYVTGDIGRIETQQAFLKAVVEQCLQIENVANIQKFARVFTDNVQTDLTLGNLVWFAEQAIFGGLSMDNVNFITMPGDYNATAWSRTYGNYQSYVLPDGEQLLQVVNESFNPYLEDRVAESQDIMWVNSDGSISSSTGIVEDTRAAQAPSRPVQTPEPSPSEDPEQTEQPEESPGTSGEPTQSPDASGQPTDPGVTPTPAPSTDPEVTPTPAPSTDPEVTPPPTDSGGSEETVNPSPSPSESQETPDPEPSIWTPPPEVVVPA